MFRGAPPICLTGGHENDAPKNEVSRGRRWAGWRPIGMEWIYRLYKNRKKYEKTYVISVFGAPRVASLADDTLLGVPRRLETHSNIPKEIVRFRTDIKCFQVYCLSVEGSGEKL